jgi:hypothetical protein
MLSQHSIEVSSTTSQRSNINTTGQRNDEKVIKDYLTIVKEIFKLEEVDKVFIYRKLKEGDCNFPPNRLDQFLQFSLSDEKRTLNLSNETVDKVERLSINYCSRGKEWLRFEDIRLILTDYILFKIRANGYDSYVEYLKQLFISMIKSEKWFQFLKSISATSFDDYEFWYPYIFGSIISSFQENEEIQKLLWQSNSIKFPIDIKLSTILDVKDDEYFLIVPDKIVGSQEHYLKQVYLIGRYVEPHVCNLKDNFDFAKKLPALLIPSLNTLLKERFDVGRAELLKEKNQNISSLTKFLNCLPIPCSMSGNNFLLPEINNIIANFCF